MLVVDDNVDAAEMLVAALASMGFETRLATDGPAALEAARRFNPEVVLLDIGLPVMDGYEVATHLRGEVGSAGATLIALTGYGQETDRARSRDAGFDHHLVKPIDLSTLTNLLDHPPRRPKGACSHRL